MKYYLSNYFKTYSIYTVALHFFCWSLFIAYELGFIYYTSGRLDPAYVYLIHYSQNIAFFYAFLYLLKITFQTRRLSYFQGILSYTALLATYVIIKIFIAYFAGNLGPDFRQSTVFYWKTIVLNLYRGVYFTILATFYRASGHIAYFKKQAAEKENRQLLAEKDKALLEVRLRESQNAYLKQQLNPHLLFNVLNFIYSRVFKTSKKASESVLLLSEIMAFSIRETGPDGKVPLAEELLQIQHLITLNRNRFDFPLNLEIKYEGNFDEHAVIPLVLFTLTENLFKHGDLTNAAGALLHIAVTPGGLLTYHSKNLKKPGSSLQKRTGIGLQNIRIRLDYSYAGKYLLDVAENDDIYELSLNLEL